MYLKWPSAIQRRKGTPLLEHCRRKKKRRLSGGPHGRSARVCISGRSTTASAKRGLKSIEALRRGSSRATVTWRCFPPIATFPSTPWSSACGVRLEGVFGSSGRGQWGACWALLPAVAAVDKLDEFWSRALVRTRAKVPAGIRLLMVLDGLSLDRSWERVAACTASGMRARRWRRSAAAGCGAGEQGHACIGVWTGCSSTRRRCSAFSKDAGRTSSG